MGLCGLYITVGGGGSILQLWYLFERLFLSGMKIRVLLFLPDTRAFSPQWYALEEIHRRGSSSMMGPPATYLALTPPLVSVLRSCPVRWIPS